METVSRDENERKEIETGTYVGGEGQERKQQREDEVDESHRRWRMVSGIERMTVARRKCCGRRRQQRPRSPRPVTVTFDGNRSRHGRNGSRVNLNDFDIQMQVSFRAGSVGIPGSAFILLLVLSCAPVVFPVLCPSTSPLTPPRAFLYPCLSPHPNALLLALPLLSPARLRPRPRPSSCRPHLYLKTPSISPSPT